MSISNSWSSFSRSLNDVLRAVVVDDVVAIGGGGGGVEPFVVNGTVELFFGDWERERSDVSVVDFKTDGINLLVVDDSKVG